MYLGLDQSTPSLAVHCTPVPVGAAVKGGAGGGGEFSGAARQQPARHVLCQLGVPAGAADGGVGRQPALHPLQSPAPLAGTVAAPGLT